MNEIEEGYKDRQTRIDGYFNCYNAALYIPDLTQGLTIDAFDALKHRLKNAFDQQREVNCKACQIAELHAEERCRNRNIWIRNTQIHIDGYWSEQLETYIDGEQLIWINSEAQNEIMDYIGHDSILMKEAAAVLVDNLYINEDDFTLSISNWDNSTNFLIASILNPNKHEN